MHRKIFITGYYGFGNTGDEAILGAMLAHLRQLRPNVHIAVTTATPGPTSEAYSVEPVLWSNALAVAEAVRSSDLVVIGGGGIFHDYWGFNPNTFLTDNHSGISFYTAPAVLAALYRKPVMLYAVGIGPLLSEHGRKFTKAACDNAELITVRDAASKVLLESIGVEAGKVLVTADPAFGLEEAPGPVLEAGLESPVIAVAARYWDIGVHPAFWEAELARALDLFLETNPGTVVFVPFQNLTGNEDDTAVAVRIHGFMKQARRARVLGPDSPARLKALLGECDLTVGMRLHSIILAAHAGTPAIALSYDPKVDAVVERLDLANFAMDVKALDAARLAAMIGEVLGRRAEISAHLVKCSGELERLAKSNATFAFEVLDRGLTRSVSVGGETLDLLRRGIDAQLRHSRELADDNRRMVAHVEALNEQQTHALSTLDNERKQLYEQLALSEAERNKLFEQLETTAKLHVETEAAKYRALVQRNRAEAERDAALVDRSRLRKELHSLHADKRRLASDGAEAGTSAEQHRRQIVASLHAAEKAFEDQLRQYRRERAWMAMLAMRKAYTLLFRRGWSGRVEFMRWALKIPLVGAGDLREYELTFPRVWSYLPPMESSIPRADDPRPLPLGPPKKYDLIILAIFDYEFRFQRPQQIAAQFAGRGHRVFWVSPSRFLPAASTDAYEAIPLRENVWEVHMRGDKPAMYTGELNPAHAHQFSRSLNALFAGFDIDESCVLLQFPFWRQVGLAIRDEFGSKLAYDCMDDWSNWTTDPVISHWNLEEEKKLAAEADVLVVTSQEFVERYEERGLSPVLSRNAADYDFFAAAAENSLLGNVPKPIVGYYGAIADWFDLELVTRLAKERPQYSFVLIGQVHGRDVSELSSLPNVRLLGEKNYREIPLFLRHFNVCLIPFVLNRLTKAVDPVKVYEYFSQGKPVVATNMAELAQSNDLLYIGRDFDEFAGHVDHAIAEDDKDLRRRRIEYAKANTWSARVQAIDTAVEQSFPLVSILLLTYNCEEYLAPCLDSIARNTAYPNYEVILFDNASTDSTPDVAREYAAANPRIRLYLHGKNLGFAAGNNEAARHAKGEYLVFLNPDTVVTPGWMGRMVRHSMQEPSAGLIAAVTNFSGNETKVNFDYGNVLEMERFAQKLARDQRGTLTDIAVAPLYCVLVSRTVWERVGELDGGFQVGMFEDDDFSLRIRNAGYRVTAADDCFIHHFGNGSFGKLPSAEALRIFEDNRARFERKWNMPWTPHKLRPGVRAPFDDVRFTPVEFFRGRPPKETKADTSVLLHKLHPPGTSAGQGFNMQADGSSALVVDCERATATTVVMFGSTMLTTSYGSRQMLSATVPPELYAMAGVYPVYLLNDFGESNRLEFTVSA